MAKAICTVYSGYSVTPLNTLDITDLTVILTSPLLPQSIILIHWQFVYSHQHFQRQSAQPAATAL